MKNSNKILLTLLVLTIILQLSTMLYVRKIFINATQYSNDIDQTILLDLMDSEPAEKEFEIDNFDELTLKLKGNVIIKQSDEYKVTVKGPIALLNSDYFHLSTKGQTLHIECPLTQQGNHDIYTIIEMPELDRINASRDMDILLEGFSEKHMKIKLTGECTLQGNNNQIDDLEIDTFGDVEVDFKNSSVDYADLRSMGETRIGIEATDVNIRSLGESQYDLDMKGGKIKGSIIGEGNVIYSGEISKNSLNFLGPGKIRKK